MLAIASCGSKSTVTECGWNLTMMFNQPFSCLILGCNNLGSSSFPMAGLFGSPFYTIDPMEKTSLWARFRPQLEHIS
jgi:hypothetical protein